MVNKRKMATKTVKIIDYKPKEKTTENCIEWITGERSATLTFSEPKMIKRIKTIYSERADEFKRYTENDDGSICVTVPKKWCKINPGSKPDSDKPKRTMTEEQKKAFAERMAKVREQKNKEKENK